MTPIAPDTARRVFRGAEPIHGMIYFTPYGAAAYAALGFHVLGWGTSLRGPHPWVL